MATQVVELTREKPRSQLWQLVALEVQRLQPVWHRRQFPLAESRYLRCPQLLQVLGSVREHLVHPLKQLVQLVVPISCTDPFLHPLLSQFPGPSLLHLRQFSAQARQVPRGHSRTGRQ